MNDKKLTLKIFTFSTPVMLTEIYSLLGNKYIDSLPFKIEIVEDFTQSNVVLWDGLMTSKNSKVVKKMLEGVGATRVLLLLGESLSLFRENEEAKVVEAENLNHIELPSSNLLPEHLLSALVECNEKLGHV